MFGRAHKPLRGPSLLNTPLFSLCPQLGLTLGKLNPISTALLFSVCARHLPVSYCIVHVLLFFFFFLEIHVFQFLSIYSVHFSIKDSFFLGGGYLNLILYSKLNSFCLQNQFKTSLIVDFCKHTLDYLWHFDHTEAGLRGRVVGGGVRVSYLG